MNCSIICSVVLSLYLYISDRRRNFNIVYSETNYNSATKCWVGMISSVQKYHHTFVFDRLTVKPELVAWSLFGASFDENKNLQMWRYWRQSDTHFNTSCNNFMSSLFVFQCTTFVPFFSSKSSLEDQLPTTSRYIFSVYYTDNKRWSSVIEILNAAVVCYLVYNFHFVCLRAISFLLVYDF